MWVTHAIPPRLSRISIIVRASRRNPPTSIWHWCERGGGAFEVRTSGRQAWIIGNVLITTRHGEDAVFFFVTFLQFFTRSKGGRIAWETYGTRPDQRFAYTVSSCYRYRIIYRKLPNVAALSTEVRWRCSFCTIKSVIGIPPKMWVPYVLCWNRFERIKPDKDAERRPGMSRRAVRCYY